jgi:hypothetical protein
MALHLSRPPLLAWGVLATALAVGLYMHWQSPMGGFYYTPRDWCAPRSTMFDLGYLGVLALATAVCVLLVIGCVGGLLGVPSPVSRPRMAAILRKSLTSFALFAFAMALTPLVDMALPLKPHPACVDRGLR